MTIGVVVYNDLSMLVESNKGGNSDALPSLDCFSVIDCGLNTISQAFLEFFSSPLYQYTTRPRCDHVRL